MTRKWQDGKWYENKLATRLIVRQ